MSAGRRRLALLIASLGLLTVTAGTALAHPLGNLTSNTYAGITMHPDRMEVDYVLDLAEVPAFQARQSIDADGDDQVSDLESESYEQQRCGRLRDGITVEADGTDLPRLTVTGAELTFPPGEAGLVTLRLECTFETTVLLDAGTRLTFLDRNDPDRTGWREVTARGVGVTLVDADVPTSSSSDRLRTYPTDTAPLAVRSATFRLDAAGAGPATEKTTIADPVVRNLDRATSALSDLVQREDFTAAFALLAVGVALFLGALHALAPGHGKTVMAAYLVSQRGTTRQALGLGLTVATTHTLGVLLLGITLSATQSFAPADLYPWLGLLSGLLFAGVGIWLLMRLRRSGGHGHVHHPQHEHGHDRVHGHEHDRGPGTHAHAHDHEVRTEPSTGWRILVLPGLAGGLVPSPSALVVLVGGIALGRTWFSVGLVAAYGLGMAATLVGAGFLLTHLRGWLEGRLRTGTLFARAAAALPAVTASIVVLGGMVVAGRSVLAL